MTKKFEKDNKPRGTILPTLSSFHLEAERTSKGLSLCLCGIIGISDFTDSEILLLSHGGRILVTGRKLSLKVYESNSVEIIGIVEGISFKYGKN